MSYLLMIKFNHGSVRTFGPLDEAVRWSKGHGNTRTVRPEPALWELQNKLKIIKIGSQEAEFALKEGKNQLCIIELKKLKSANQI